MNVSTETNDKTSKHNFFEVFILLDLDTSSEQREGESSWKETLRSSDMRLITTG
jgi:hypothetical protein